MTIADLISHTLKQSLSSEELAQLAPASAALSKRYREASYSGAPLTPIERYAYLLARLPATHAAVSAVLDSIKKRLPDFAPSSMIDIGAGPGTASFSAQEIFASLKDFVMLEKDPKWIAMGRALMGANPALSKGAWLLQDLSQKISIVPADLIIAAYSFQELPNHCHAQLAKELYAKATQALVIIEPGTPRGFENIRSLRTTLLNWGAHVVAPCTHSLTCPLKSDDWCHFSARLNRHELHRKAKSAALAYEDEKYSYLVVSKNPAVPLYARVLRGPLIRSGHVILDLCSEGQYKREVISRSRKELFRESKKMDWGSQWNGIQV